MMIKRCWQALALAMAHSALAFAGSAAHGSVAAPAGDKYQTWRAAAAQTLIGRGDANSTATAAALRFTGPATRVKADSAAPRSAAVELAVRASELDPENPTIAWLRLQLCAGSPGCDIRDAATTMRWVDADNGAAWIPTLAGAQKERDAMEVDRILADMAQGARFDLYWNRTVVLLFDALKKAGSGLPAGYLPSDLARLLEAMDLASSETIPSLTPLLNACREAAGAERREMCLRVSKIMQRGDTVIAQMAGFSIEKRLSSPDSKEGRAVAEHRRILEWRVSKANQFGMPMLPWLRNSRARARVVQMRAMPREEDVDIAILRGRKLPLEPPEDHR
jgi:hypothetical protein